MNYDLVGDVKSRILRYELYENFINEHEINIEEDIKLIADRLYKNIVKEFGSSKFIDMTFSPFIIGEISYNAAICGDWFCEIVRDNCKPIKMIQLPAHTMYRIETIKGELLEFQQSKEGPDYQAIARCSIDEDDGKALVVRFKPSEIVHIRINCSKFYPYGTSCLEKSKYSKSNFDLVEPIIDNCFEHDLTNGIIELVEKFKL